MWKVGLEPEVEDIIHPEASPVASYGDPYVVAWCAEGGASAMAVRESTKTALGLLCGRAAYVARHRKANLLS